MQRKMTGRILSAVLLSAMLCSLAASCGDEVVNNFTDLCLLYAKSARGGAPECEAGIPRGGWALGTIRFC